VTGGQWSVTGGGEKTGFGKIKADSKQQTAREKQGGKSGEEYSPSPLILSLGGEKKIKERVITGRKAGQRRGRERSGQWIVVSEEVPCVDVYLSRLSFWLLIELLF
jgi:hypothetical protein